MTPQNQNPQNLTQLNDYVSDTTPSATKCTQIRPQGKCVKYNTNFSYLYTYNPIYYYFYVAAKATLYSFASWQNRLFGGVFGPSSVKMGPMKYVVCLHLYIP